MTRRLFVAGNWKMNLSAEQSRELAGELSKKVPADCAMDVAVCPPSVYLASVKSALDGSVICLGGQDVYWEANGAFTGQLSTAMLLDVGCDYVIVGHSERRHTIIPAEDDVAINRKVLAGLTGDLKVILCIGETLEERQGEQTEKVLDRQLTAGMAGVGPESVDKLTIAYEPVWAIGTGQTASTAQAQEAHAFVRGRVGQLLSAEAGESIRIQHGGSVKPVSAPDLMRQPDIDGALVGGASLDPEEFARIIAYRLVG